MQRKKETPLKPEIPENSSNFLPQEEWKVHRNAEGYSKSLNKEG